MFMSKVVFLMFNLGHVYTHGLSLELLCVSHCLFSCFALCFLCAFIIIFFQNKYVHLIPFLSLERCFGMYGNCLLTPKPLKILLLCIWPYMSMVFCITIGSYSFSLYFYLYRYIGCLLSFSRLLQSKEKMKM